MLRGRRLSALLAAGLLAVVAGCGGDETLAPQVPGPPADVTVPDEGVPEPGATDEAGDTSGDTTDDATTPDAEATAEPTAPEGTGDTGTTTEPDASGGASAPAPAEDGPDNDTPPPEGSNAQQFEDFCAQNPGAC